jgi:sigma-B regulation protein RsbU (phosphoserine phosphatase)
VKPEAAESAEVDRLRRELARANRVAEASYALHTTLDVDKLLGLLLATARDGVDADRGTVFLLSEDGKELWSKVLSGDKDLVIRLPVGKGIAGTVAKTGETINIVDAHEDARFDASWDRKSGFRTRQILCMPIKARDGRIVGVFQLLNKKKGNFDADDETFLDSLSVNAALAVENAVLHKSAIEKERQDREIALVQSVQRGFQPERLEATAGDVRIAGMNELCEDASGDYYDMISLPDGRTAIALGDVSGHGLGAALVMAQARALLRAFCHSVEGLAKVMDLLNDFLAADLTRGKFISLFVGILDPKTSRMEWCNAGHLPPIVVRADGSTELLEATGRIVGILPDAGYESKDPITLKPGDLMLLYTDGVTEANDPKDVLFGEERLVELLRTLRGREPVVVLDRIREALLAWTKRPRFRDDLTLVALAR